MRNLPVYSLALAVTLSACDFNPIGDQNKFGDIRVYLRNADPTGRDIYLMSGSDSIPSAVDLVEAGLYRTTIVAHNPNGGYSHFFRAGRLPMVKLGFIICQTSAEYTDVNIMDDGHDVIWDGQTLRCGAKWTQ